MKGHVLHFMLLRIFSRVVLTKRWANALHVEQVTAMVVFSNVHTNTKTNANTNSKTNAFHVDRLTQMVSFSDSQKTPKRPSDLMHWDSDPCPQVSLTLCMLM